MKSKYLEWGRLNDQVDTAIRDAEIRAYWGGLEHADKTYNERISIVKAEFNISRSLIEKCLYL